MPHNPHFLLEVAIASVEDAVTAQACGADRIELNSALYLGGLTPSLGMVREVRQAVALPLIVMARPRPGGFAYSSDEFRVMQRDVELFLEQGAEGIAFGVLAPSGEIDCERCKAIVQQIGN